MLGVALEPAAAQGIGHAGVVDAVGRELRRGLDAGAARQHEGAKGLGSRLGAVAQALEAGALLLQIFSENQLGPIFFEFIQRKGDEGFGEGNFKALFEGLDAMPAADRAVRAALDAQCEREGLYSLYRELQKVDPVTAARLKPADRQRIGRALEVYRVSGQPLSSFHHEKATVETPPLISLEPTDRAWLHQRIEERFAHMLDAGLVDEVESLMNRGDLHADMPSMRCVGYRQVWEALEAGDLSELPERGIAATRQLGKRQLTWLRSMPQRHVVACDAADAQAQVVALAQQLIAGIAP